MSFDDFGEGVITKFHKNDEVGGDGEKFFVFLGVNKPDDVFVA